jgi:hypothetical protein
MTEAMKLEEKILDYIRTHAKGVQISEMEKPLGANRMKLGYVLRNLINEDKVLKIENYYFPRRGIKKTETIHTHSP